ncbi:MAG: acyl carrier protein [Verrucomicrobiota bacterium]|jgi:acyl carrier protein
MTKKEFLIALGEVVGGDAGGIRGDESLRDLDGWDSMASVAFMAMADERLGKLVGAADLAACKTVSDLMALFPGQIS